MVPLNSPTAHAVDERRNVLLGQRNGYEAAGRNLGPSYSYLPLTLSTHPQRAQLFTAVNPFEIPERWWKRGRRDTAPDAECGIGVQHVVSDDDIPGDAKHRAHPAHGPNYPYASMGHDGSPTNGMVDPRNPSGDMWNSPVGMGTGSHPEPFLPPDRMSAEPPSEQRPIPAPNPGRNPVYHVVEDAICQPASIHRPRSPPPQPEHSAPITGTPLQAILTPKHSPASNREQFDPPERPDTIAESQGRNGERSPEEPARSERSTGRRYSPWTSFSSRSGSSLSPGDRGRYARRQHPRSGSPSRSPTWSRSRHAREHEGPYDDSPSPPDLGPHRSPGASRSMSIRREASRPENIDEESRLDSPAARPHRDCRSPDSSTSELPLPVTLVATSPRTSGTLWSSLLDAAFVVTDFFPRQLYLLILLRIPSLYFSRVTRVFEDARLNHFDIEQMAKARAEQWNVQPPPYSMLLQQQQPYPEMATPTLPVALLIFKASWEEFIDSLMKEWKTLNIVSVLLLSCALFLLDPPLSMTDGTQCHLDHGSNQRSVTSRYSNRRPVCVDLRADEFIFGCMYIIRFGTMRKMHKASRLAAEAQRGVVGIWWNVWVLLAMPAVWLSWSLVAFLISIMSFIWLGGSTADPNGFLLHPKISLAPQILLTAVFVSGLIYFVLTAHEFHRYGDPLDREWSKAVDADVQRQSKPVRPVYSDSSLRPLTDKSTPGDTHRSLPRRPSDRPSPDIAFPRALPIMRLNLDKEIGAVTSFEPHDSLVVPDETWAAFMQDIQSVWADRPVFRAPPGVDLHIGNGSVSVLSPAQLNSLSSSAEDHSVIPVERSLPVSEKQDRRVGAIHAMLVEWNRRFFWSSRFNSLAQQLCVNDAEKLQGGQGQPVVRDALHRAAVCGHWGEACLLDREEPETAVQVRPGQMTSVDVDVSQDMTWTAEFMDRISEIRDSMNVIGSLQVKSDAVGGGRKASASFFDPSKLKESDIDFFCRSASTTAHCSRSNRSRFHKCLCPFTSDSRLMECSAMLAKYTSLKSFYMKSTRGLPLDYENAGVYSSVLLDAHIDYKVMWCNIQQGIRSINVGRETARREVHHIRRQSKSRFTAKMTRYQNKLASAKQQHPRQLQPAVPLLDVGAPTPPAALFCDENTGAPPVPLLLFYPPDPPVEPEETLPPNELIPYEGSLSGLGGARRDCRSEIIKIRAKMGRKHAAELEDAGQKLEQFKDTVRQVQVKLSTLKTTKRLLGLKDAWCPVPLRTPVQFKNVNKRQCMQYDLFGHFKCFDIQALGALAFRIRHVQTGRLSAVARQVSSGVWLQMCEFPVFFMFMFESVMDNGAFAGMTTVHLAEMPCHTLNVAGGGTNDDAQKLAFSGEKSNSDRWFIDAFDRG
ncbi:unnamed protein product [Mycena citricolor]|uniref:Uncharacterized protein n=1 Tax=Mycena citricolor TaxID=2018698 RepID=A0AAD2HEX4_9AGAR|nr:unnamed protein product [Mycena citricolor]